jgi:hypothetical protein
MAVFPPKPGGYPQGYPEPMAGWKVFLPVGKVRVPHTRLKETYILNGVQRLLN